MNSMHMPTPRALTQVEPSGDHETHQEDTLNQVTVELYGKSSDVTLDPPTHFLRPQNSEHANLMPTKVVEYDAID